MISSSAMYKYAHISQQMWGCPLGVLNPPKKLNPSWNEVPWEDSDFNLLRERVCTSLSINTWGLDWTHLKSLAVNERDCEVTRLYRAIIICLERRTAGNAGDARSSAAGSINVSRLSSVESGLTRICIALTLLIFCFWTNTKPSLV